MLFLEYPPCSTCQKARAWLDGHNIPYTARKDVYPKPRQILQLPDNPYPLLVY